MYLFKNIIISVEPSDPTKQSLSFYEKLKNEIWLVPQNCFFNKPSSMQKTLKTPYSLSLNHMVLGFFNSVFLWQNIDKKE